VLGLPTEGHIGDRRRVSSVVQPAPSVSINGTIDDVLALGRVEHPIAVLGTDRILLGALQPTARGLPGATPVEQAMIPAPGTIRPDMRIDDVAEQLQKDRLDHIFVTTVAGVLLGLIVTDELHV
jgi:CBS domain-containing protein